MKHRGLALALGAVAGLAFALVAALARRTPSNGEPRAAAPTAEPASGATPEATTTRPSDEFKRSAVARDANAPAPALTSREPLAPRDTELVENALLDNSVLVEVRVLTPSETSPLFPHPYAGGTVHVMARASSASSDMSHRAPIESDGIARFRFESPMHVAWFRAEHRRELGHAPAFLDVRQDLPAGALFRVAIQPERGGRVLGRVTTLDGLALSGLEVAAYAEELGLREPWTDDWSPAHFTTRSGASGEFEFSALPEGRMYVLVPPGEWLQLAPDYAGEFSARAWVDVELGEAHDIGTLKLARRAAFEVRVIDSAGRPAAGAAVELAPLRFDGAGILLEDEWREQFEPHVVRERQIAELGENFDEARFDEQLRSLEKIAETTPVWPTSGEGWITDRDGRARGHVVAGEWELRVRPMLGADTDVHAQVVRLPAAVIVVTLPSRLVDIEGRVVETRQRTSIGNVKVEIEVEGPSEDTRTDERGRFRFASVFVRAGYRLSATHVDYFSESAEFGPGELEPVLAMKPAQRFELLLRSSDGVAIYPGQMQILAARLDGEGAGDPRARAWLDKGEPVLEHAPVEHNGRATFHHLWPGEYELGLALACDSGRNGEWGEIVAETCVVQRWTLRPGRLVQELTVDLSSYRPATATRYATLRARVVDAPTGLGIDGATLEIVHPLRTRVFELGEGGVVELSVPIGSVSATVRHPEYETLEVRSIYVSERDATRVWKLQPLPGLGKGR
jgi:hypothetical protein